MKLKKLLGNKSHWVINKELAREIGLNETLILQHLIDWSDYHKKKTIFQTYEQIQSDLGLSEHAVKKIGIPKLKELGFISTERKGVGYKTHYTIHEDVIVEFLTHPSREVNTTHLSGSGSNSPTSEVNTPSLIGENNLSSGVNTTHPTGESTLAISNNIAINNVDKESINKESTTNDGWSRDLIENKILDVLRNPDIHPEDKRYITAIEYYKEAGRFEGISQKMEWDNSVKNNWWTRVLSRIEKQIG